jgi:transketolase
MENIQQLEKTATQVRRDIIRMVHAVQSGHPGGSMGCADFLTALYFAVLDHNPKNFTTEGKNQDLFFLSNGHISPAFYSVLARSGYFPVSELATFRKLGTRLQGHPSPVDRLPGVRIASGSLGQGLSVACGASLAKKLNNDSNLIYSLHGDGELQEGQIWEAAMFAAANKIDNLIATIDYNGLQIDGTVQEVLSLGDLRAKWEAFGWTVVEFNGNIMQETVSGLKHAKTLTEKEKPVCIIMHTKMGFGVDFMTNENKWHGSPTNEEQTKIALEQLTETLGDY